MKSITATDLAIVPEMNTEPLDFVQYRVKVIISISCGVNQSMRLRLCK